MLRIIALNVAMPNAVRLSITLRNDVLPIHIMLSVVMLGVVMLGIVILPSVIVPTVIMISFTASFRQYNNASDGAPYPNIWLLQSWSESIKPLESSKYQNTMKGWGTKNIGAE
jgi:hypothetical protein